MKNLARCGNAALSAGVVLEDGFCKYILLENGPDTLRVAEAISQRTDTSGNDACESLFSMLAAYGAPKEVPIAFALRFDETVIKIIDMRQLSAEDVKLTLRYQFEDYFPFSFTESNYDVQEIIYPGLGKPEKRFLAAACRAKVVRCIKADADSNGFRLSCVEPAQISFERAVTPEDAVENLIEIYAGKNDLLFILSSGGNGIFYRNAVIKGEERGYIGSAAAEAKVSLDFARQRISDFKADRVAIAGPKADAGLCEAISRELGYSRVERISPLSRCGVNYDAVAGDDMILSFGAALRRM